MKSVRTISALILSCVAMVGLCSSGVSQSRPKTNIKKRYVEVARSENGQEVLRSMERSNDPDLLPVLKLGLQMPGFGATYLRILDFVSDRPSLAKTLTSDIGVTFFRLAGSSPDGERNTLLVATANVLIKYADSKTQAASVMKSALEKESDPWVMAQVAELLTAKGEK